jgi:hypothetical protein
MPIIFVSNSELVYRWGKRVLEWRPRLGKRRVDLCWTPSGQLDWRFAHDSWLELNACSRRSSEMTSNWRGLYPAVDCAQMCEKILHSQTLSLRLFILIFF